MTNPNIAKWKYTELLDLYIGLEKICKDSCKFRIFSLGHNIFFTIASMDIKTKDMVKLIQKKINYKVNVNLVDEWTIFCHLSKDNLPRRLKTKVEFTIKSWTEMVPLEFYCETYQEKKLILDSVEELLSQEIDVLATTVIKVTDLAS